MAVEIETYLAALREELEGARRIHPERVAAIEEEIARVEADLKETDDG